MHPSETALNRLTGNVVLAGRLWRKRTRAIIADHGVSEAGATPLIWIARLGGDVRQNVVAEHCGIEGPSLVRLLDDLVRQGLVVRRQDPSDRRANLVTLTPEGEKIVAAIENHLAAFRLEMLGDLPAEDVATTLHVLDHILEVARRETAPDAPVSKG